MPSLVNDKLLDALAKAESSNNPRAIGDAGKSVGAYQMQPSAFQDVQEFFPDRWGKVKYDELLVTPSLQREAARAYLHVGEQKYGIADLDRLISFYNAGPRAREGDLINSDYINKVKRAMGLQSSKVDPIEDGIRHVFRMTAMAGFDPLSAKEIEEMLVKFTPPTALPGVEKQQPTGAEQEQQMVSAMSRVLNPGLRRDSPSSALTDEIITPPGVASSEWSDDATVVNPLMQSLGRPPRARAFIKPAPPWHTWPGPPEFPSEYSARRMERKYGI